VSTVQCVHCDFCGKSEHEAVIMVRGPKADICDECAAYVLSRLPEITDDQIDAVARSMPGGMDGFCKGWGWRQFAREVLKLRAPEEGEPS
jgi:hypothetical protein